MTPVETLRDQALKLLQTDDSEAAAKAATLLKTASDIEQQQSNVLKLDADRRKVEQELESSHHHIKDLLIACTPILTTLILAGTLVFQVYQSNQAAKEKRQEVADAATAAERTRFMEAAKVIQTAENISPSAALLNTFSAGPFHDEARRMGVKLLIHAKNQTDFRDIFTAVFDPVTAADVPGLIELNRSVALEYGAVFRQAGQSSGAADPARLNQEQRAAADLSVSELNISALQLVAALKLPRRPDAAPLDLSGTNLGYIDLSGVDLHGAALNGVAMVGMTMDGCDLSGAPEPQALNVLDSAWWRAARISQPLLEYLIAHSPFVPGMAYPEKVPVTQQDYEMNLERLRKQNQP